MNLEMKNMEGKGVDALELDDGLLVENKGSDAVYAALVAARAGQRSGSASTRTKAEANYSGAKPWRQKGTGRARAGLRGSPIWRGGGVAFGPKPRSYSKKISRKTARLALKRVLSDKIGEGDLVVLDKLELSEPRTKDFVAVMKNLVAEEDSLVVIGADDENIRLSSRNLAELEVTTAQRLNVYQLVRAKKVVVTEDAVRKLEKRLV